MLYFCIMRLKWLLIILMSAVMASCSSSRPQEPNGVVVEPSSVNVSVRPTMPAYMPRAIAYRTDGDFADNVPVRYDAVRNALISFPAPSDLRRDCKPVPLADGWLLDRIGVGDNTVYTRYTIDDYSQLPTVPSVRQLIDSIIPDSRVTAIVQLPFTTAEALADTAACNRFLRNQR